MKNTGKTLAAALAGLFVSLSASAAPKVVNIAENVTTNLEASAYSSGAKNTIMVAAPGSTIVLAKGSGDVAFHPHLVVSGGVVRVTCKDDSSYTRYRFVSGIRAVEGGLLEIDGAPEISVDRQDVPSDTEVMPSTGPICDIGSINFANSNAKGLLLRYNSTVRRLPTNCVVRVDSAVGSTVALACDDVNAAAPLLVNGELCLTNFNVIALTPTCLPDGCTVRVSPKWAFTFKTGSLSADGLDWVPGSGWTGRFNIVLGGRGARVRFINPARDSDPRVNCRCVSNVSGVGEVFFKPESGETGISITRFGGFAYVASREAPISIPVDSASEPPLTETWKSKVSHWFDVSDETTLVPFTFDPSSWGGNWVNATNKFNGHQLIIGIKDKVEGSAIALYNSRIWNKYGSGKMNEDYVLQVMPYLVEGGLNGKSYICCGDFNANEKSGAKYDEDGNLTTAKEGRRLRFWNSANIKGNENPPSGGAYTRFVAAYAILVFGSQQGGGRSVIGTDGYEVASNGYLIRNNGTDKPWAPRDGYSMHVDGLQADTKTSKPSGGWQIVSIDMTATNTVVTGLGTRSYSDSECGGQNYAEVIFFSEKPTVAERAACEQYLAAKWGLAYTRWDNTQVPLSGTGKVQLNDDANESYDSVEVVEAIGSFSGTVTIPAGQTLNISRPLPPTDADVPEANRVGWYDPDFPGAAITTDGLRGADLNWILYGRTLTELCDGQDDKMFAGGGTTGCTLAEAKDKNFCPQMVDGNRSWLSTGGTSRKWLVFKEKYSDGLGNVIRPKRVRDGAIAARSDLKRIRQAFFVTDTSAGGGSIISEDVNFNGSLRYRDGDNVNAPIWPSGNTLAMEKTWLDTTEVDGTTTGYNGRPEVLSFATAASTNFLPSYIAYYKGDNTEIIGEFIFYSTPLGDEDRVRVQEYLMYKWFGDLNNKYADYTGATVTGAGNVKSPTLRNLPQFGSGFTGSLVGGSQLSFTVGDGDAGVADAIDLGRALALEDGATITVNFTGGGRPKAGSYTLLTATTISGTAVLDAVGLDATRSATLHVGTGAISVEVKSPGMTIIVL